MAPANRLIAETSPYLLQHAKNPVDWFPWCPEAFSTARAADKPILLSIGYSACHWCHVMEHESFEDPGIAGLMNELFVCIKVDREERPDIDDVYMKAVQLLTGHGGWPLTVFLMPSGEPFSGGTYFPPTDRHGLPGFSRVLQAIAGAYRDRRGEVSRAGERLIEAVRATEAGTSSASGLDPYLPEQAALAILEHVDWEDGGLGAAPKFPHTSAFQTLLRRFRVTGQPKFLEASVLATDRMAAGGMYDQIGGGFHRYSVDRHWLVPHFEKMLYDNAQLPRLYLELYQITGSPNCRRIVEETVDYLLGEMRHPEGGFFSATDADSDGEEGQFFLWTPEEVARAVEPRDVELACRYWGITAVGNFEGKAIAHRSMKMESLAQLLGVSAATVETSLARARAALYAARSRRVSPLRDEKILTAWNALAIGTLAEVGRVLGMRRYLDAGTAAADFLWHNVRRDGHLLHSWTAGRADIPAFLDDHAFFAAALLDLYEATGVRSHLTRAEELCAVLDDRFRDQTLGGYFFTPHDGERLIARPKPEADGALPSGNAVASLVALRLHALTGSESYRLRAEEVLRLHQAGAKRAPLAFTAYLEALERYLQGATEVIVVGPRGRADTEALWTQVAAVYLPHRALVSADPADPAPLAPARGRPVQEGRATAYVCRNFSCSAPVVEPGALRGLLEARS